MNLLSKKGIIFLTSGLSQSYNLQIVTSYIEDKTNNIKGIKCTKNIITFTFNISQAKPAITFNKVCPAIIFANNLTGKLMAIFMR